MTARVVLLSTGVAVLLGTALVILIVAVTGQRDAARTALRSQEALTAGSQLEKSLISMDNGLRGYVASGRERFLAPTTQGLAAYRTELAAFMRLASDEPEQQRRVDRLAEAIDDYVTLWARPLMSLARDRPAAARSAVITRTGRIRLERIRSDFRRLFERERAVARERAQRAEQRSELAVGGGVGGLVLVLVVAVGVALYLRRSIVRPVTSVAEATGRLASGDLSVRVPARREDEIGDLARSFNAMAERLQAGRSELAAREQQLERSNRELTRSNRELEQFASMTSHDLQAPLVTVSMYAELLERQSDPGDARTHELVDGIRSATGQARTLIRDLLDYSRAGRGRPRLEEVEAMSVVDQALDSLAGDIEASGAHVVVGPLPTITADVANLCRVFQNLVGNAIKFTGEQRPRIAIGAAPDGDSWRFWVRDNGIGMPPEHAERIFQPFQRLHGEEDFPGTGIGLAVCERIVEQHGGRIWVESSPGQGSTFSFMLPMLTAGPPSDAGTDARAPAAAEAEAGV